MLPNSSIPNQLPSYEESCNPAPRPIPPATAGAFYREHPGGVSIKLDFVSVPGEPIKKQAWYGVLHVKCDNVPETMRQGLFIGPGNIVHEDGYLELTRSYDTEFQGRWPYTRHHYLRDL
ncbi:hypothetical protein PG996_005346 [Apiospora saccharicola]|uniref:Uncharacterized protein n=1 Tax=Apiospora saccharicola TaxID=335842 RepID=A0ABR1VL66_9PEZI